MLAGGETGKGFRGGDRLGMGSEREESYPERLGGGGNQGCRVTCAPESASPVAPLTLEVCQGQRDQELSGWF